MCFVVLFYKNRKQGEKVLKGFSQTCYYTQKYKLAKQGLYFHCIHGKRERTMAFLSIYGILGKGFPVNQSRRKTST